MDINLEKLKKLFVKKKDFKKENLEINPNLYWRYLLIFVGCVISLSFVFGVYVYWQVAKMDLVLTSTNEEVQKTNQRDRILEMVQYFRAREQKTTEIQNSKSPVVDPSL